MKLVRRGSIILILVATVSAITWYLWPSAKTNAWIHIPEDAWYVLTTNELLGDWEEFVDSEVWQVVKHHPEMEELAEDVSFLDTLFMDNQRLLELVGNSPICISAHPVKDDYDFLYFLDLGKSQDASAVKSGIHLWATNYGYSSQQQEFFSAYTDEEESFYLAQIDQVLIFTFHPDLANGYTTSTNRKEDNRNWNFEYGDGFQLYVPSNNYKALTSYYLNEIPNGLDGLDTLVDYLKLRFQFDDQVSKTDGEGYWKADANWSSSLAYNQASKDLGAVLPARTAWASRYSFESIDSLFEAIEEGQESVRNTLTKTSKVLDVDVYDLITSWVGNSVTFAQLDYSLNPTKSQDAVVLIATDNLQKARTKIRMLEVAIQRRTPGKIRRIDYKGQVITYPGISGLFKPFLSGKLEGVTIPYYAFIGKYLALSSDPKTLAHMLEDRAEGNTCQDIFRELDLDDKSSTFQLFFSTKYMEKFMYSWLVETDNMNRSIQVLSKMGTGYLNLSTEEAALGLEFVLYTDSLSGEMLGPKFNYESYVSEPKTEAIEWIDEGVYRKFYAGTNLLQIEAKTKDGLLHGKYTEYYRNGKVKAVGKFKRGLKTGTWKYYDLYGDLENKEKK